MIGIMCACECIMILNEHYTVELRDPNKGYFRNNRNSAVLSLIGS